MPQTSTYLRRVTWLPPAARIPSRRSASVYDMDAATASRACASEYLGPRCGIANVCSPTARTVRQLGSPDSNRVLTGQSRSGRRLPHSPILSRRYHRRDRLAGLAVVGAAAGFAPLRGGWAAGGQDAEDAHCLQSQAEALAAVG